MFKSNLKIIIISLLFPRWSLNPWYTLYNDIEVFFQFAEVLFYFDDFKVTIKLFSTVLKLNVKPLNNQNRKSGQKKFQRFSQFIFDNFFHHHLTTKVLKGNSKLSFKIMNAVRQKLLWPLWSQLHWFGGSLVGSLHVWIVSNLGSRGSQLIEAWKPLL